nr:MAG TPA: hypothetical protein [Caudoviricetes sp.]DAN67888.1 MAG TPA: hypothetical protein [Caudoviricetes sp.]DAQ42907.1 MAG TPA: hypothetical protein [Caudoviricetes sp.]
MIPIRSSETSLASFRNIHLKSVLHSKKRFAYGFQTYSD